MDIDEVDSDATEAREMLGAYVQQQCTYYSVSAITERDCHGEDVPM